MGKKKVKNKRKTELRIIFFIILVAAALFIISTYAWFSTQKNVSITNLSGIVEVAEGLEISLDAKHWMNEIVLGEGNMDIIKDAYSGHRNITPKELLPVSTLGTRTADKGVFKDLTMLRGTVENLIKLKDIVQMDEGLVIEELEDDTGEIDNSEDKAYPGYFAFDIFLKNSTKQGIDWNVLQLNYDSSVQIIAADKGGDETAGLQNTVRVALARYGDDTTGVVDSSTGTSDEDQLAILKATGADGTEDIYIEETAIWEPNASDHVQTIVDNNNKITWSSTDGPLYGTLDSETGIYKFGLEKLMPTYALNTVGDRNGEISLIGETIEDIYVWNGTETKLDKQYTLQTTNTKTTGQDGTVTTDYLINEGVQDLILSSGETYTEDYKVNDEITYKKGETKRFEIPASKIIRVRVYVWLEGQDVDCTNYASYGGGIIVNLGLVKDSKVGSHGEAGSADNT